MKSFAGFQRKYSKQKARIGVISKAPEELLNILLKNIVRAFECDEVDVIYCGSGNISRLRFHNVYEVRDIAAEEILKLNLRKYSVVIYLTENSHRVFLRKRLIKGVKAVPAANYCLMNFNFELFNYFASKWFPQYARLFFDWEVKGHFYKQEPLYFVKDIVWFIKTAVSHVVLKRPEFDRVAAKEIMEFRDYHLRGNRSGLVEMDKSQMSYEFERIKTRDDY